MKLAYFSKVLHMPMSNVAHLQFLKDVSSVLLVFSDSECLIFTHEELISRTFSSAPLTSG